MALPPLPFLSRLALPFTHFIDFYFANLWTFTRSYWWENPTHFDLGVAAVDFRMLPLFALARKGDPLGAEGRSVAALRCSIFGSITSYRTAVQTPNQNSCGGVAAVCYVAYVADVWYTLVRAVGGYALNWRPPHT